MGGGWLVVEEWWRRLYYLLSHREERGRRRRRDSSPSYSIHHKDIKIWFGGFINCFFSSPLFFLFFFLSTTSLYSEELLEWEVLFTISFACHSNVHLSLLLLPSLLSLYRNTINSNFTIIIYFTVTLSAAHKHTLKLLWILCREMSPQIILSQISGEEEDEGSHQLLDGFLPLQGWIFSFPSISNLEPFVTISAVPRDD